jgi:sporulation protein YlmC with PRC-barrel domain
MPPASALLSNNSILNERKDEMNSKEDYQARVQTQVEVWSATIEELRVAAEQAEEEAREKYYEVIDSLSVKRMELLRNLEILEESEEEVWEETVEIIDRLLTSMQEDVSGLERFAPGLGEQELDWVDEITGPESAGLEEQLEAIETPGSEREETVPRVTKREDVHLGESLIGKSIVSINDGRIIGPVRELYLDRSLELVTAVMIGDGGFLGLGSEGGLFGRRSGMVKREDVVLFGIDTILIRDSKAVKRSDQIAEVGEWLSRAKLKGRPVDTPGGTKIGILGDIVFNNEGRIVGFKLSQALVEGPIARKRAITREVVVDTGNEDGVMTIDLGKAEEQEELVAGHLG